MKFCSCVGSAVLLSISFIRLLITPSLARPFPPPLTYIITCTNLIFLDNYYNFTPHPFMTTWTYKSLKVSCGVFSWMNELVFVTFEFLVLIICINFKLNEFLVFFLSLCFFLCLESSSTLQSFQSFRQLLKCIKTLLLFWETNILKTYIPPKK